MHYPGKRLQRISMVCACIAWLGPNTSSGPLEVMTSRGVAAPKVPSVDVRGCRLGGTPINGQIRDFIGKWGDPDKIEEVSLEGGNREEIISYPGYHVDLVGQAGLLSEFVIAVDLNIAREQRRNQKDDAIKWPVVVPDLIQGAIDGTVERALGPPVCEVVCRRIRELLYDYDGCAVVLRIGPEGELFELFAISHALIRKQKLWSPAIDRACIQGRGKDKVLGGKEEPPYDVDEYRSGCKLIR